MKKVKIIADTCCDLTVELMEKYDIDYARMMLIFDGKEYVSSLGWEEISPKQFYDGMRNKLDIKTTQVPPAEFERIFTKYIEEGYDIVYVGTGSKVSSSVNTGTVIAKEMLAKYPDAVIECIDPDNSCMGQGILALYAAELAKEGKSAAEIRDAVLAVKNNVREYIALETLTYMSRAGRITEAEAYQGNLMGVKPIISANSKGYQVPVAKVIGRKKSLDEVVRLTKEAILEPEKQTIYLVQADASEDDIEYVKNKVMEEIPCKGVYVTTIGTIVGNSVGPGSLGLFSFGKKVEF